jgi:hypothetical protein
MLGHPDRDSHACEPRSPPPQMWGDAPGSLGIYAGLTHPKHRRRNGEQAQTCAELLQPGREQPFAYRGDEMGDPGCSPGHSKRVGKKPFSFSLDLVKFLVTTLQTIGPDQELGQGIQERGRNNGRLGLTRDLGNVV